MQQSILRISDNRRFLQYDNGTPFFYLGDTVWELFHRADREEAEYYLEDRASKNFTVIQAVILAELDGLRVPNSNGDVPLINNDPAQPNEKYFRHVDFIVQKAASLGLTVGLLPTWGDKWNKKSGAGPEVFTAENASVFGEFLGRRYRDFPVIWILGGDRPVENEYHCAVLEAMAAGIKAGDGGRHLMTFHPNGRHSSSVTHHDAEWLDFNMLQSGHSGRNFANYEMVAIDYALTPPKPCMDAEPCYENHPVMNQNWEAESERFNNYDVRKAAYHALFAGAHGHTYGCHEIWQLWQPGRQAVTQAQVPWREALQLPGAKQMQHARKLLESKPFFSRIPDQSLILEGQREGGEHLGATRDANGSYALVYFAANLPATIDLGKLAGNRVLASWFDPRDGSLYKTGQYSPQPQEFEPPSSVDGAAIDWVLVLDSR